MSTLMSQARNRVPRIAEAAVERARLSVVPRSTSRRAARVPFVALVSLLLIGGVVGLLFFNTSMQQVSFTATRLEEQAARLDAQRQGLQMELDQLRDPQRLALRAKDLGMVPASSPAFIRLGDGAVLGTPTPATAASAMRVTPPPTRKPRSLNPKPLVITLSKKAAARLAERNGTASGGASARAGATSTGTKKTQNR